MDVEQNDSSRLFVHDESNNGTFPLHKRSKSKTVQMKLLLDIAELKHITRQDQQPSRTSNYGASDANTRMDVGYQQRHNSHYQAKDEEG